MKSAPLETFHLSRSHWQAMRADVMGRLPEEACGLVAGLEGRSRQVFPITNILHSPVRYRLDPQEQIAAFQKIEQQAWEIAAIYHSHPSGPAYPSETDIAEAYYPDSVYLIWSPGEEDWQCRAYVILDGRQEEIRLVIQEDE